MLCVVVSHNCRVALALYARGSVRAAIAVMEQCARCQLKPLPYASLSDWYLRCDEKHKAQEALERGVKERDPPSVLRRVEYVRKRLDWLCTACFEPLLVSFRDMMRGSQPDLLLATSLLRTVFRDDDEKLWQRLTAPSLRVCDEKEAQFAVQRMTQINSTYPLRQLVLCRGATTSSPLLTALSTAITIESVCFESDVPKSSRERVAVHLKALPSLCDLDLRELPIATGLELLQSRKNWTRICPPTAVTAIAKASAFVALNQTDFELQCEGLVSAEQFDPWLHNPHLTGLRIRLPVEAGLNYLNLDGLANCKTLTSLV